MTVGDMTEAFVDTNWASETMVAWEAANSALDHNNIPLAQVYATLALVAVMAFRAGVEVTEFRARYDRPFRRELLRAD